MRRIPIVAGVVSIAAALLASPMAAHPGPVLPEAEFTSIPLPLSDDIVAFDVA